MDEDCDVTDNYDLVDADIDIDIDQEHSGNCSAVVYE